MLAKSVCVLFSGKAGVGKTTSAKYMQEYLTKFPYDATIGSFAYGVKRAAIESFYWDGNKDDRGRKLLQEIGALGRRYNENIWCETLIEYRIPRMSGYPFDFVLVDDWRFPNEANFVSGNPLYSLYTVRIEATNRELLKGTEAYNDISEVSLDEGFIFNYFVNNSGSLDALHEQLVTITNDILVREVYFEKEK